MTWIYALREPHTGAVRYIGKADDPRARLRQHLADRGGSLKATWIQSLPAPPVMDLLEECENWRQREGRWIERLRARGIVLVNDTPGFGVMYRARADPRVAVS